MRVLTRAVFVLASVLIVPAGAYAQASITGTFKDTSRAVLPGVSVAASRDVLIEKVRAAVTDRNGRFQLIEGGEACGSW